MAKPLEGNPREVNSVYTLHCHTKGSSQLIKRSYANLAEHTCTLDKMDKEMSGYVEKCETKNNVKREDCMKQVKESKGKKLKLSGGCESVSFKFLSTTFLGLNYDNQDMKCLAQCVGKEAGVVDDKGHRDNAKIEEHIKKIGCSKKKERYTKMFKDCKDEEESWHMPLPVDSSRASPTQGHVIHARHVIANTYHDTVGHRLQAPLSICSLRMRLPPLMTALAFAVVVRRPGQNGVWWSDRRGFPKVATRHTWIINIIIVYRWCTRSAPLPYYWGYNHAALFQLVSTFKSAHALTVLWPDWLISIYVRSTSSTSSLVSISGHMV
uniref:Uncharacterized protein n=1 Tax=Timema genevievae TaxID=629358 RepID=A0A7R9JYY6_TIMGE|nr:unnamed protein product [Timema genevievae]